MTNPQISLSEVQQLANNMLANYVGVWSGTNIVGSGRPFSGEDIDRAKNQLLYGLYMTDREMAIDAAMQTPVGKILYG